MASQRVHPSVALLAVLLGSSSPGPHAATLRVPEQYPGVREAVDAAVEGDRVLVSAGEFGGFYLRDKNIEVTSVSGPESTVLRGSFLDTVVTLRDTSSHVHGFTVRSGDSDSDRGGGIVADGGAPTIEDMIVTANYGGGIAIYFSAARVHHNRIVGNYSGHGLYLSGADATVYANVIENNWPRGVVVFGGGSPVIFRNVIRGNGSTGVGYGSGILAYPTEPGRMVVADNLIVGNHGYEGGGLSIFSAGNSHSTWVNNTFADNTASHFGAQATIGREDFADGDNRGLVFANNVFSGEGISVHCISPTGESPVFDHNDVYPAAGGDCAETAVTGSNFSADPKFTLGNNGRPYHLSPESPLVDAGSNDAAREIHRDLGKRPRVIDGGHGPIVDIGAYEYWPK